MTRSAGTSGLTRAGSPPRSAIASRMTARSTTAGTPVKSWRTTRAGMNGISASAAGPAARRRGSRRPASATIPPPAWRSTFSSRILSVTGRARSTPSRCRPRPGRPGGRGPGGRSRGAPGRRRVGRDHVLNLRCGDRAMRVRPRTARYTRSGGSVPRRPPPGRRGRPMRAWDEAEAALLRADGAPRAKPRGDRGGDRGGGDRPRPAGAGPPPPRRRRPRERPRAPTPHSGPGERPVHRDRRGGRRRDGPRRRPAPGGLAGRAVASRDPGRRERFRGARPGRPGLRRAGGAPRRGGARHRRGPGRRASALARRVLRMYAGQAMVHTSGALGAEVLAPAMAAGTQVGAFHPLVAFADLDRALAALHGATIAIEGDDQLAALLADMAEAIGGVPVRLAPGSKAAYHAAAVLAAGGFVALLDAIAELGARRRPRRAGLARDLRARSSRGPLANARALGIAAALTGPMTRGDVGTLDRAPRRPAAARPRRARRCTSPRLAARSRIADRAGRPGTGSVPARLRAALARPA